MPKKLFRFAGVGAGLFLSTAFTFTLFQQLATDVTDSIIFGAVAIVIESAKISLIINALRRDKAFITSIMFAVLLFAISLSASISYWVYAVSNAIYEVVEIVHIDTMHSDNFALLETQYKRVENQIQAIQDDIARVEAERADELARLNNIINETPADFVTLRRELTNDRTEILAGYDTRIDSLRTEIADMNSILDGLTIQMGQTEQREVIETITEERRLKDGSLAGYFVLLSGFTELHVDSIVIIFAVVVGIALDITGLAFCILEKARREPEPAAEKPEVDLEEIQQLRQVLEQYKDRETELLKTLEANQGQDKEEDTTKVVRLPDKRIAIKTYKDFCKAIADNGLKISDLKYKKILELVELNKSTFYKYLREYKEEKQQTM